MSDWSRFPQPVGLWLFNEGAGGLVNDLSGNGNVGTLQGTAHFGLGKFGSALVLDGDSDFVDCGDIDAIDVATELTVLARVYHNNITADQVIASKADGSWNFGFVFYRDDAGSETARTDMYKIYLQAGVNTVYLEGSTGSSPLKTWTQVAFTWVKGSATGLRLYVNGIEDAESPVDSSSIGDLNAAAYALQIGISPSDSDYFNGLIDHVMIFNRALTASQIAQLYQNPFPWFKRDPIELWAA
ncbi:unnamed protein product, partial [marine sediment metagenome]